ncbi:hypothetical protein HFD88_010125 [Aspergillus terreus]|nr:hypothetical protein HFD88_010125 [Aspergillus terreus]
MSEAEVTYFSDELWLNQAIKFPQSPFPLLPPSSWKPTRKISEYSIRYTQEEAGKAWNKPSNAHAVFECENSEDSNKELGLPSPGAFARVVADEAHAIKTTRTRNHQAVALLQAENFWGLTATPIWNRPGSILRPPLDFEDPFHLIVTSRCHDSHHYQYLVQLYQDAATDEENPTGRLDRDAVLEEYLACGKRKELLRKLKKLRPEQFTDVDLPFKTIRGLQEAQEREARISALME